MNPPPPPFTVSPSTYTGVVYPGGENDGLPSPVFQALDAGTTGLRIDGDPNNGPGFTAWWEWALPAPLPANAYLDFDMQWWAEANYVIAKILGDGVEDPNLEYSMGPRSTWESAWRPSMLGSYVLPVGITTLRYELSADNSQYGTSGLSAIFRNIEIVVPTPGVPSGGDTYQPGDVVRHSNATWLALTTAYPGEEPGVSPAWVRISRDGLNYQGDWS